MTEIDTSGGALVLFSCGKDSLVCLDICSRIFHPLAAFFMYDVKDLQFQEEVLQWCEERYRIKIDRVPDPRTLIYRNESVFEEHDPNAKWLEEFTREELEDYLRDKHKVRWLAGGEKKADSMMRRTMLNGPNVVQRHDGAWNPNRRKFYPVANYTDKMIMGYMRNWRIPVPSFYQFMKMSPSIFRGGGERGLEQGNLALLKKHYPADYEKSLKAFPLISTMEVRDAIRSGSREKVQRRGGRKRIDKGKPGEPPQDQPPSTPTAN